MAKTSRTTRKTTAKPKSATKKKPAARKAAAAGDMEAFVKALQKNSTEKKEEEGMDLD